MEKNLLQYIRALTAADSKSLSQKALKAAEEVGELAKKVLPFENAHATTHRFVERRDILEECIDVSLVVRSIAISLGFSDDDWEEMLREKSEKWASLQAREAGVKYPLPFELHVTVRSAVLEQFRAACAALHVKPIVLALQARDGGTVLQDVMTSSVCFGTNRDAVTELERIADGLTSAGLQVVRRKIETVPWHPAAPAERNGVSAMPPGGYFECHFNVIVLAHDPREDVNLRMTLAALAQRHGAHLSHNVFKALSPPASTVMMTLRKYEGCREQFEQERDALALAIKDGGFTLEKLITEFSLFDSAIAHDASWLRAS